ncbi:hypothetical protein [Deinococcus yavapaiensis]|nr:hypothetical protein [Deinococcus yavapaiensis]
MLSLRREGEAIRVPTSTGVAPSPASTPTESSSTCSETPPHAAQSECEAILAGMKVPPKVREVFEALLEIALRVVEGRAYRVRPDTVCFHGVQELLAAHLRIGRTTLWRYLGKLKTLGVIDKCQHKGTSRGVTRNTGTLFKVATRSNLRVKLLAEELRYAYRDLDADREVGRTAFAFLKQSEKHSVSRVKIQDLAGWALGKNIVQPAVLVPDRSMSASEVVDALPQLLYTPPAKRVQLIGSMASVLSVALRDQHSRGFYILVLEKAVKAEFQGLRMLSRVQCVLRLLVVAARQDEWRDLKRPGAMVVRKLGADLDILRAC